MTSRTDDKPMAIEEIFAAALGCEAGAARAAYLDAACGGDAALRAQAESLLAAHERAGSFMAHGEGEAATLASRLAEGPGTVIGRYKLLQQIGEGGFGVVFLAEQREPVQRKVALKVIKLGMDTRAVVARFEQERQALAMMDHANIAKVLDAGATESGRPYFVMELVKGDPITAYCDTNNLSVEARLGLFGQVCHAVQHAHQKGIIHRDIKPSNVLVTIADGKPIPKVIDFGIAKATLSKLTEKTLFTEHRALIGTPEYMSPEQAEMTGVDIDTRSDIYSLGVLLYELLTGALPFDSKRLRSAAFGEIQRIIREEDPPNPSTRLSTLDTLASVAAHRHTEPARLSRLVKGDLDWIVMKALEKDRTRRYETANALAADVERHLTGEPVLAAPPSSVYKLREFVRRNKGPVAAGAAVAASLLIGVVAFAWQAKVASDQRDQAIAAREAEAAERRRAEIIAEFMSNTLEGVGPSVAMGRDTTMLREMMDSAAAQIENGELKETPEAELRLRLTIGAAYQGIAAFEQAQRMLEPALSLARTLHDGDHKDVSLALHSLGTLREERGDLVGAERLFRDALEMNKRLFPGDHAAVAANLSSLAKVWEALGRAAEAEPLFVQALEMYQRLFPGDHPDVATSLNNLAYVRSKQGRAADAEPLFRQALEMRQRLFKGDHPHVARGLNNLAKVWEALGRAAEAEPLFVRALEMSRRLFPGDHPYVATSLTNLAHVRSMLGRTAEAEPLFLQALEMRQRLFKGDHPDVATDLNNLASVRKSMGRAAEAELLYVQSLDMLQRLFPGDHPNVANTLNNLAGVRDSLGRAAEAEPLYVQALEMRQRLYKGDHPELANGLSSLASVRNAMGRAAEAEPLFVQALEMLQRLFKGDHPYVALSLDNLASVRNQLGREAEAEPLFVQALEMYQRLYKGDHPDVALSLHNLASARNQLGRAAEAEPLFVQALEMYQRLYKGDHPDVADGLNVLASVRLALGRAPEAEPLFVQALEMRQRLLGDNHPDTAAAKADLAGALVKLQNLDAAEQLFRQALETWKQLFPGDSPQVAGLLVGSAQLLEKRGNSAGAGPLHREAFEMNRRMMPAGSPTLSMALALFGGSLLKTGRPEAAAEAEPLLRECLEIRRTAFPDGHREVWRRYSVMRLLGGALLGQADVPSLALAARVEKLREAEPLLLDAYAGVKDDPAVPKPELLGGDDVKRDALERIVRLYETWESAEPGKGYQQKAEEWRKRLEGGP